MCFFMHSRRSSDHPLTAGQIAAVCRARWNCTVGSVITKLLVAEEMYARRTARPAPERLVAHTFVSRQGQDDQRSGVVQSTQTDESMFEEQPQGTEMQAGTRRKEPSEKSGRRGERNKKTPSKSSAPAHRCALRDSGLQSCTKEGSGRRCDDEQGHRRDEMPEFVAEYMILFGHLASQSGDQPADCIYHVLSAAPSLLPSVNNSVAYRTRSVTTDDCGSLGNYVGSSRHGTK